MSHRYGWLVLALLLGAVPASAQHEAAISTVKDHFVQHQARYGADDLTEFVVTDAYVSRRSGATYVYLRQAHNGIEVINAPAQAAVADGRLVAPSARLVSGLAARVNAESPSLSAEGAAAAAVRHLSRTAERPERRLALSDAPNEVAVASERRYPEDHFTPAPERARLVYYALESGPVRLAWHVPVDSRHGFMWGVIVDAERGNVLAMEDWTASDTWHSAPRHGASAAVAPSLAPLAPSGSPLLAAASGRQAAGSGSYNVFPMPFESPNHGPQTVVATPHNPTASPEGWHSDGSNSFTITRGNNVWAYEDRDANNVPGMSPDGGASLVFNFPFDPELQPVDYQELAVTNLFYWNNIIHDVAYQYGFDEASGNFQTNNFGNGGNGNDAVRAEAQDGSGTDNANFSTPPDGGPGRMQMYEWSPGHSLQVTAPPAIAGFYDSGTQVAGTAPVTPDWGDTDGYSISEELVRVQDKDGDYRACGVILNGAELNGKIALIRRGECPFAEKVYNVQQLGAIGAIIRNCNTDELGCEASTNPGETVLNMSADPDTFPNVVLVTIPAQFVARSVGLAMEDHLPGVTVAMEEGVIARDSDLDAGVIVHEYGHGISNRLTGGPSQAGCLSNGNENNPGEQMGEGWSDFYGLMLTQQVGDTGTQPRGVGTYLEFHPVDGLGIRPAPYSTDRAINDYTYGDLPNVSRPHGIGFIWATMLWDMTWYLINDFGYDPDVYNAGGTAGNQIALNLVTEAMKLQPCHPGFVDGRDAILAADELLYDGAYYNHIWTAFTLRGLGLNADQGSSLDETDGMEDFTFPPDVIPVGVEQAGTELPEVYRLGEAYPNPFNPQAQFSLEVAEAQTVRIELYDVLGRRVALLHDGELSAGTAHRFTIDGARLASGTYTYRVVGETFTATKRVTLLK